MALSFTLGAASVAFGKEVTPAQIEALKERIEDIDDWLADAEEDRSALERQLAAAERTISRLTRERRSLAEQVKKQQQRLANCRKKKKKWRAPWSAREKA